MHHYTQAKDMWVEAEWAEDNESRKSSFRDSINELMLAISASKVNAAASPSLSPSHRRRRVSTLGWCHPGSSSAGV